MQLDPQASTSHESGERQQPYTRQVYIERIQFYAVKLPIEILIPTKYRHEPDAEKFWSLVFSPVKKLPAAWESARYSSKSVYRSPRTFTQSHV